MAKKEVDTQTYAMNSFSTKQTVLDKNVAQSIDFGSDKKIPKERIRDAIRIYTGIEKWNTVKIYADIERWYKEYLVSNNVEQCISLFDRTFPFFKDYPSTKKIDFFLWLTA